MLPPHPRSKSVGVALPPWPPPIDAHDEATSAKFYFLFGPIEVIEKDTI